MALDQYLDVMALGLNDQQHGDTTKLGSADPHMLAAYCFDLTRKQHYLYMALRLSGGGSTRFEYVRGEETIVIENQATLAQAIYEDTQFVEAAAEAVRRSAGALWNRARDWEARAYALEEIVICQWRAIQQDHDRLFALFHLHAPTYLGAPGRIPTRAPSAAVWPEVR